MRFKLGHRTVNSCIMCMGGASEGNPPVNDISGRRSQGQLTVCCLRAGTYRLLLIFLLFFDQDFLSLFHSLQPHHHATLLDLSHTHPWIDTASQLHPGSLKQRWPHTTKPPPPAPLGLAPCHYFDFIPVCDSVHAEFPLYVHQCPCHPRPCHFFLGGPLQALFTFVTLGVICVSASAPYDLS